MIKITDDLDLFYVGKEDNRIYLYPCEAEDCKNRRLVKKKDLIRNPGIWTECSLCQYLVTADLYKRKKRFHGE